MITSLKKMKDQEDFKNEDIILEFVPTEDQLADIFTKSLNSERFEFIRGELGLCDPL